MLDEQIGSKSSAMDDSQTNGNLSAISEFYDYKRCTWVAVNKQVRRQILDGTLSTFDVNE